MRDYNAANHGDERTNLSDVEIKELTILAAASTAARATRAWNRTHPDAQVAERTTGRYLQFWRREGKYFKTDRGRSEFLTGEENALLVEACEALRRAGNSLTADEVCNMAIGIVDRDKERRGLLAVNGGPAIFSTSWGNNWLRKNKFNIRHATTDRVISPDKIREDGAVFNQLLGNIKRRHAVDPRLCFNMDEFFVQMDANRSWTWTRVVPGQPISIGTNKLGFTMSITTSPYEVVLVQIIWRGKTDTVHVETATQHGTVHQMHRADSHFQNGETFEQWSKLLLGKIQAIRAREHIPADVEAILILDQAPQHININDARWRELIHVAIPKKQTHIWQPADQWIIACFKKYLRACWKGYLKQVFKNNDLNEAVKNVLVTSLPVLRARKYSFVVEALSKMQPDTLFASWERTGILRELFDIPVRDGKVVVYDTFADATDEVELPVTDDEDEDVDAIVVQIPLTNVNFVLVEAEQPAPAAPTRGRPKKVAPPPKVAAVSVLAMLGRKRPRALDDID